MSKFSRLDRTRFLKGVVALLIGCALNYFGDQLLDVHVELTRGNGIQGFTPLWAVDVFILPFFVGFLVASIFGIGGKWLSHFPPLIVRSISYYEFSHHMISIPEGASLAPIGFWVFITVLSVELCAAGGVVGEIMMTGTYGRSPRHKNSSRYNEGDIEA
jgi:hypothetical protein